MNLIIEDVCDYKYSINSWDRDHIEISNFIKVENWVDRLERGPIVY